MMEQQLDREWCEQAIYNEGYRARDREIVRCKECKWRFMDDHVWVCPFGLMLEGDDGFCNYGERAEQTEPKGCALCKHESEPWYSEACDGCCKAHSSYEPQTEPKGEE